MDFVTIGNAGNAADTGGTVGRGAVSYNYRIGKYEITNAQWNAFTAAAGAPTGNSVGGQNPYNENSDYTGIQQPTNCVSWFEALQFCNYLTSGNKSKGVYQFSGDNANPGDFLGINRVAAKATYGIIYFLPTADEWYKAAFYKPDNSGYSIYANGQNTLPSADNGWNYTGGLYSEPWNVGTGAQEQNGTFDMMGNVWEMTETEIYSPLVHVILGGSCFNARYPYLNSSGPWYRHDIIEDGDQGFRVASVPEPATLLLLGLGARLCLRLRRGKRRF